MSSSLFGGKNSNLKHDFTDLNNEVILADYEHTTADQSLQMELNSNLEFSSYLSRVYHISAA